MAGAGANQQILMIDFEGYAPEECNRNGIIQLFKQGIFKGADVDLDDLQHLIESEDDDDDNDEDKVIFGLTTAIDIEYRGTKYPVLRHIQELLVEICTRYGADEDQHLFSSVLHSLESQKVGLLINERFLNIPQGIATPLMRALKGEIEAAVANGVRCDFTHFIMISKMVNAEDMDEDVSKAQNPVLLWANPEEEFLYENSIASFDFPVYYVNEKGRGDDDTHTIRRFVLFTREVFHRFVDQLH
ncbi:hypothetical protein B566_EDAN001703 [Ephemera danica]|nr:hypothetical protein B566_EDAN001703 [Ephemera danica]